MTPYAVMLLIALAFIFIIIGNSIRVLRDYERAVIFRLGRKSKAAFNPGGGGNGPGLIILVPIIGALTQRFSAYRMVMLGAVISAASVFVMALPTAWFEPLAAGVVGHWLGHGYLGLHGAVHPYYVMIALFVVLLSVGEAFYSPRVYEYAAAIAPRGQEASYGALSYVPFLLAKLLVGTFSGMLLARYCPEHGERHSEILWLAVALTATVAPVGLILLRGYIRVREAGRED